MDRVECSVRSPGGLDGKVGRDGDVRGGCGPPDKCRVGVPSFRIMKGP